jgi:hypothetical protein
MPSDQIQPDPEPRRRRNRDLDDEDDDRPRRRRRRRDDDDEDDDYPRVRQKDAVETFIPYRNPMGLIAYYLGVFSLIPCAGLFLGPAGLILGIMGLKYRKKNPTAGGGGHAIAGIVLGSIASLLNLGAVIVFVIAIASK